MEENEDTTNQNLRNITKAVPQGNLCLLYQGSPEKQNQQDTCKRRFITGTGSQDYGG